MALRDRSLQDPNPVQAAVSGDNTGALAWLLPLLLPLALVCLAEGPARAQSPSPNQPMAIDDPQGLPPRPCPLIVPPRDFSLQPLRIQPSQVNSKNAMGCLSPADAARYGADGCPLKLCGEKRGALPLPQL